MNVYKMWCTNLLADRYFSIKYVGVAWSKKWLETALQSLFVCYFPSLLANRYQLKYQKSYFLLTFRTDAASKEQY